MGVGESFGEAFAKAQLAAGTPLPDRGALFISVNDRDKPAAVPVAARFREFGFELYATRGTAAVLKAAGLSCKTVFKVNEGRPNAVDWLKAGKLNLVIYTTTGWHSFPDEQTIRRNALLYRTVCITTMSGARAAVEAVASRRRDPVRTWNLQELHSPAWLTLRALHSGPLSRKHPGFSNSRLATVPLPVSLLNLSQNKLRVLDECVHFSSERYSCEHILDGFKFLNARVRC